jgi:hypothetical protein
VGAAETQALVARKVLKTKTLSPRAFFVYFLGQVLYSGLELIEVTNSGATHLNPFDIAGTADVKVRCTCQAETL